MTVYVVVALVVCLALVFTYTNGFQDGSSVAASALASRSLSKKQTILLVAAFELLGALLGGSAVAGTIAKITSWPAQPDLLPVLASGLAAAIGWNVFTRLAGLPSSSTHALIGGMIGAVIAACGDARYIVWGSPGGLINPTGLWRVVVSLFLSPVVGFSLGYVMLLLVVANLKSASAHMNILLKRLQWLAVPVLAFGHGANDSQKAMGVILLTLYAAGFSGLADVPFWVRCVTGISMALGVMTLAPRIVQRVGGIYKLRPLHGFVAECSSGLIVVFASLTGGPLAASQVIASTVIGVGTAERKKGVHWLIARDMVQAWFLTIPCAAAVAWIMYSIAFVHLRPLCYIR